jgi:hypothetical protein
LSTGIFRCFLKKYAQRIADVIENPDGDVAKEYGGADEAAAELSSEYYS